VKDDKSNKKMIIGMVVSDKMNKSITVEWEARKRHPVYKKFIKRHMKIMAHDEKNEASIGDVVKIVETRPTSKKKSWKVSEIIEKAQRSRQS
jgi:small subunit ribosomal protein S17